MTRLKYGEIDPDVASAATGFLSETAGALGLDGLEQLPLDDNSGFRLGNLATSAAATLVMSREQLATNILASNTLFGSFVPAVIKARSATIDIAYSQGQFTPMDEESLAKAGSGLNDIREYLAPFVLQGDANLPPDVPPISLGTILRLKGLGYNGKDTYLSSHPYASMVDHGTGWPSSAEKFEVPVLVDPQMFTLEEFENLDSENADGYAHQVVDTWRSICEEHRDHPSYTGQPLVIRAVGVLPVPPADKVPEEQSEFAVDFLPHISKAKADIESKTKRAYDVHFLVKGNENVGANYVEFDYGTTPREVYADADGMRAPLTVTRAEAIKEGDIETFDDLGLTPRSQGTIALLMAPHVVIPKAPVSDFSLGHGYPGSHTYGVTRGVEPTKGLGGANVQVGPGSDWIRSEKREESLFGRVAPELQGRPIIVSLQLLTFQA